VVAFLYTGATKPVKKDEISMYNSFFPQQT